jgi:hypothetical protein
VLKLNILHRGQRLKVTDHVHVLIDDDVPVGGKKECMLIAEILK